MYEFISENRALNPLTHSAVTGTVTQVSVTVTIVSVDASVTVTVTVTHTGAVTAPEWQ